MDIPVSKFDTTASYKLILASIDFLDRKAMGAVGLFRVAANLAAVRELLIQHKIGRSVDVNACDDPHVVAALLLQLLRDREPSVVDFNRMNVCDLPKDGMGPASTVVPLLRGLFAGSSEDDITLAGKLCALVSKVCQGQSTQLSSTSGAAASTAMSLASIIGPAICRPPGSAFMSIRHKQAVPRIRDTVKALFLHAAAVFTNLHASATAPSAPRVSGASLTLPVPVSVVTSRPSSDDESGYESPPYMSSGRGPIGTPKQLPKVSGISPPSSASPQSPTIAHKATSYIHPGVHKAIDALLFFTARDFVSSTVTSPLGRSMVPEMNAHSPLHSPPDAKATDTKLCEGVDCVNPFCPAKLSEQASFAADKPWLSHGSSESSVDWFPHDTLPGVLAKALTVGWTSQGSQLFADSVDSLSSSLDSVHLSAAPILSPSMSRRLDAKRARMIGGVEPRTPPVIESLSAESHMSTGDGIPLSGYREDEGLEGLGVTVNSPISAEMQRARPSATARRIQIAKCKALRTTIRDFEAQFQTEHGHQPRGPERSPLRNVYLQYRRLKQGVRENAATHIQMVFRGHCVRKRHGKIFAAPTSSTIAARRSLAASDSKFDIGKGSDSDANPVATLSVDVPPASSAAFPAPGLATSPASAQQASSLAVTTAQLRDEKSQLKHRLRAFDLDFKAKHGRLPSKADKEVIRHLYKRYHDVKALLLGMEATSTAPTGGATVTPVITPASAQASTPLGGATSVTTPVGEDAHGGDLPDSIKALQREKRTLQHHLRKFEEEFLKTHGRKVKFQKDIVPVAEDYQRYKEIKTALAAYNNKQG